MKRFPGVLVRWAAWTLVLCFALLVNVHDLSGANAGWFTFTLPWDDSSTSFLSYDNGGPITQPIRVGSDANFHLGSPTGPRLRLFGTTFTGGGAFLSQDQADKTAARLEKLGFNFVRFTLLEAGGLVTGTNPITFNETKLDQLFYFISKLKEHGIYVDIMLHITGSFDVPDVFFDPAEIQLQKDYARILLTERVNPYTDLTLAQDPVLGQVQFINEVYMLAAFRECLLHTASECGGAPSAASLSKTFPPLPQSRLGGPLFPENVDQAQSDLLDDLWNQRLVAHYGTRANLDSAWSQGCSGKISLNPGEDPTAGTVERLLYKDWNLYCPKRLMDTVTFYYQLGKEHVEDMFDYLKNTLGLGDLPITTIENFAGLDSAFIQHFTNTQAFHVPWAHPYFFNGGFMNPPFQYVNAPMVKGPAAHDGKWPWWIEFDSTIWKITAAAAVNDRPIEVSEYSHPLPNEFQAENPLLIAAYAAYQDWDAIILHEYSAVASEMGNGKIDQGFEMVDNPVIMAQIPAAARLFRNDGWIQVAGDALTVPFWEDGNLNGTDGVLNDWWNCNSPPHPFCDWEKGFAAKGTIPQSVSPKHALVRKTEMRFDTTSSSTSVPSTPTSPYVSDTGQLRWDTGTGLVTVNTPQAQAAVGFLDAGPVNLANLQVTATGATDFAAISLVPLDELPLAGSQKLLLTAVARGMNTGMNPAPPQSIGEHTFVDWGTAPVLVEPVLADITLTLPQAASVQVFRLTETGQQDTEVPVTPLGGGQFRFSIGTQNTLWYGIVITPADPNPTGAVFKVERSGDVFSDQAYHGTSFQSGSGADLAEWVHSLHPLEAGDVVEIDPEHPRYFRKSRGTGTPAGVISTRPGMTLARPDGWAPSLRPLEVTASEGEGVLQLAGKSATLELGLSIAKLARTGPVYPVLLALVGRVPVKVTLENGPIRPGDLLTPSRTRPGYAMRCSRPCRGPIIGKALQFPQEGMVEALLVRP